MGRARSFWQRILLLALTALWASCTSLNCAFGAEFDTPSTNKNCSILIRGQIQAGDFDRFVAIQKQITQEHMKGVIRAGHGLCLNSPGGNYGEALRIARHIFNEEDWSTTVDEKAVCYSACAIIWLAGTSRFEANLRVERQIHIRSSLGFHAPYITANGGSVDADLRNL